MNVYQLLRRLGVARAEYDYLQIMCDVENSEAALLAAMINCQLAGDFQRMPGPGPMLEALAKLRAEMGHIVILGDGYG